MIIQEPTGTISVSSAATTRQRRLRLSLLLALVGLALFVGSYAFTGMIGIVLLVSAGALGLASIVCTLMAIKQVDGDNTYNVPLCQDRKSGLSTVHVPPS
jgi:uncharacterized Tic20 family protein